MASKIKTTGKSKYRWGLHLARVGFAAGLVIASALAPLAYAIDCTKGGEQDGSDILTRVNKLPEYRLSARFTPSNLASIPLRWNGPGRSAEPLRAEVIPFLDAMLSEAEGKGLRIRVYSAYRSFQSQCGTYRSKFGKFRSRFRSDAELEHYVQMISAEPGRSEHQLGTTVDLVYPSLGHKLAFPDLPGRCGTGMCKEYAWLRANAHRFGFALSYPRPHLHSSEEMNPKTGYIYEPWHWRFIGVEEATALFEINSKTDEPVSVDEFLQTITGKSRSPSSVSEFVIGMGGDVALSRTGVTETDPRGATYGRFYTWEEMTVGLQPLTNENELNFLNLESVVTDRRDLKTDQKFSQRSHPKGVEHLIRNLGFNMISTANNHATDFGTEGLSDTYNSLEGFKRSGLEFVHSGVGRDHEVAEPQIIEVNGVTIAFAAIGMKGDGREDRGRPSTDRVGMLSIRRCGNGSNEGEGKSCPGGYTDYERVLNGLKNARADFRILSIHEGTELAVHVNPALAPDDDRSQTQNGAQRQRRDTRNAIPKFDLAEKYGIDLIIGHHSHNVRPVRYQNGKLALFGLGNFLFLGGQNYDRGFPDWNRYGLFVRAHYSLVNGAGAGGPRVVLSALEATPLKSLHIQPQAWEATQGSKFITYLNEISAKNFGDTGVIFKQTPSGAGVYCVSGVPRGERAEKLCAR